MTDKYYKEDLCNEDAGCKLYNALQTQGQCEYYNQWCELKQENADLKLKNIELKEQLAKKDKEIEELKEFYDNMLQNKLEVKCVSATEEKIKEIRKQVCDEFKKAIITESIFDTEEEARYWTDDIDVKTILEIIDKIEQGE